MNTWGSEYDGLAGIERRRRGRRRPKQRMSLSSLQPSFPPFSTLSFSFVFVRATKQEIFEEMPIYVRLGMHLLFVEGGSLVSYSSVESMLLTQSIKQGKVYDEEGPEVSQTLAVRVGDDSRSSEEVRSDTRKKGRADLRSHLDASLRSSLTSKLSLISSTSILQTCWRKICRNTRLASGIFSSPELNR